MRNLSKFLLFAATLFAPTLVFAANIFEPSSGDISLKILSQLFGGLVDGGGVDAFGSAISTFNGAILSVGGILAAYTVLAGTLGTAHDGEMLGKKFSSVWIPIRYSVGTALVLPITSAGYCGMQMLVMWCITQGIGLADSIWISYLQSPSAILSGKMQQGTKNNIKEFALNVALATSCTASMQKAYDGLDPTLKGPGAEPRKYDMFTGSDVNTWNFGEKSKIDEFLHSGTGMAVGGLAGVAYGTLTTDSNTACGTASLVSKPNNGSSGSANAALGGSTGTTNAGRLGDFGTAFIIPQPNAIYVAHNTAALQMMASIRNAADAAAAGNTGFPISTIDAQTDIYVKSVESAATAYVNSENPFAAIIAQSQTQGWILAGTWYTKLTMLNSKMQTALNSYPTANGSTEIHSGLKGLFTDDGADNFAIVQKPIMDMLGKSDSFRQTKAEDVKGSGEDSSAWTKINQYVTKKILSTVNLNVQDLQNDTRLPIIIIQDMGSSMIDIWQYTMAGLILAGAASFFLGSGAQSVIQTIIGFLMIPIGALVGIGFTLAYLLPNLPMLMWTGVVLGWIIMCIEAIIAAPLWAVMHLHPNGDDLTGRGGNGYMLLLGLILRPALTIFGLIAAFVVTDLMGEFVNKIFFNTFYVGEATGFRGLMVVIFSVGIYTMAQFSMFKKTFSLMHVIPDQLMQWVGGGGSQLGQYAGSIADEAGKGAGTASVVSGFVGKGAVDGLASAGQARNQISQQKKTADAQTAGNEADEAREIRNQGIMAIKDQSAAETKEDGKFGSGTGSSISDIVNNAEPVKKETSNTKLSTAQKLAQERDQIQNNNLGSLQKRSEINKVADGILKAGGTDKDVGAFISSLSGAVKENNAKGDTGAQSFNSVLKSHAEKFMAENQGSFNSVKNDAHAEDTKPVEPTTGTSTEEKQ